MFTKVADGKYLFQCLSFQLNGCEDEHMEACSLLVRFENLNHCSFQPLLTSINSPSKEEHISGILQPGTWETHIEFLAATTYYNIPLYYGCHNARKRHHWELSKPLRQPNNGFRSPDLAGCSLQTILHVPPHHLELSYTTKFHYDTVISEIEDLCVDSPPVPHETMIIPAILH